MVAKTFNKVIALSCCLSLIVTTSVHAQVKDGRKTKESWRDRRRRDRGTATPREKARLFTTERGQPGWRAAGDSGEMTENANYPLEIGGKAFQDLRVSQTLSFGLTSDDTIFLARIYGNKAQQVTPMSPVGDVKDYFVYKGWPYYINKKNELRSINEASGYSRWDHFLKSAASAFRNHILKALAITAAGFVLISGVHISSFVNYHHIPWYYTSGSVLLASLLSFAGVESVKKETYPKPASDVFKWVVTTSVSAVRYLKDKEDFEIDHFDSQTKTNVTDLLSNLVGARRARTIETCAAWLTATYR